MFSEPFLLAFRVNACPLGHHDMVFKVDVDQSEPGSQQEEPLTHPGVGDPAALTGDYLGIMNGQVTLYGHEVLREAMQFLSMTEGLKLRVRRAEPFQLGQEQRGASGVRVLDVSRADDICVSPLQLQSL